MREITKIMKGWEFTGPDGTTTTVDLPHTWNARDGQDARRRLLHLPRQHHRTAAG